MGKMRRNASGKVKFSIRSKLLTGFLIVLALLIFVSVYTLTQVFTMADKSRQIDKTWMPSVTLLGIMNGDISDVERLGLAIIVEQNPSETEKLNEALKVLLAKMEDERKQLLTLIKGNPEAEQLYEQFSTNYDSYLQKMPEFIEYGLKNDYETSSKLHTADLSIVVYS